MFLISSCIDGGLIFLRWVVKFGNLLFLGPSRFDFVFVLVMVLI